MIGILCENKKKKIYSKKFFKLLNIDVNISNYSIIVFSISDLDIINNKVSGFLVTQNEIKYMTLPIPNVINNFLSPRRKVNKKKIKTLAKQTNVTIINEVNHFDLRMIIGILQSCIKTTGIVPDYYPDIQNYLTKGRKPDTITLHAIRNSQNDWNVLPLYKSRTKSIDNKLIQDIYKATQVVSSCIGNFIPSLAFCTIRFTIYEKYSPSLLNFSGWNHDILLKRQRRGSLKLFSKYFFSYNNFLLDLKERRNHVD